VSGRVNLVVRQEIIILPFLSMNQYALAAWRSGHSISLKNSRHGFKSRKGVRFRFLFFKNEPILT
jgi:hypothetical protein